MERLPNPNISKVGVGLRHTHFPYFESGPPPQVDFFEAITENFLSTRGRPFTFIEKIRSDYPLALHGVSLSMAGEKDPPLEYLKKVKSLIAILDPFIVSDHLCWTGGSAHNLHNLLPIPFNLETKSLVSKRIKKVQDFYQRKILIENVSAYFTLNSSTEEEASFMNDLCKISGCGILLDINNIYVNSVNQKFNPYHYLDKVNFSYVEQIHLAGHSDMGDYLFDTHSKAVADHVWDLYRYALKQKNDIPTLIEWDEDIPPFQILEEEVKKAKRNGF